MAEVSKEVERILDERERMKEAKRLESERLLQKKREEVEKKKKIAERFIHRLNPKGILEALNNDFLEGKGVIVEEKDFQFAHDHSISVRDGGEQRWSVSHTGSSLGLIWKGEYKGRHPRNYFQGKLFGMIRIGIIDGDPFVYFTLTERLPRRNLDVCQNDGKIWHLANKFINIGGINTAEIKERGIDEVIETAERGIARNFVDLTSSMEKSFRIWRLR